MVETKSNWIVDYGIGHLVVENTDAGIKTKCGIFYDSSNTVQCKKPSHVCGKCNEQIDKATKNAIPKWKYEGKLRAT